MGGSAGDGEPDEPAPHLRRIFAGFTYKHANWMASLGRSDAGDLALSAGGDSGTSSSPLMLSGTPLGDLDDDDDVDQGRGGGGSSSNVGTAATEDNMVVSL